MLPVLAIRQAMISYWVTTMDILSAELTETIKKDRKLTSEEDARYAVSKR